MKHTAGALAPLCAGLLWAGTAGADYDGYDLHMMCSAPVSTPYMLSAGMCLGYVSAIAGVLQSGAVNGERACIPETASSDQKRLAVKRWLDRHPEARGGLANRIAIAALVESYPCR